MLGSSQHEWDTKLCHPLRDIEEVEYHLFAVSVHRGTEMRRGHYVTYIKRGENEWVLYDNNQCYKVCLKLLIGRVYVCVCPVRVLVIRVVGAVSALCVCLRVCTCIHACVYVCFWQRKY